MKRHSRFNDRIKLCIDPGAISNGIEDEMTEPFLARAALLATDSLVIKLSYPAAADDEDEPSQPSKHTFARSSGPERTVPCAC